MKPGAETGAGTGRPAASQPRAGLLLWLAPVALLALALVAWEVAVAWRDTPEWFLPPPSQIGQTLWHDRTMLASDAWVTLQAVVIGFGLAAIAGVALAVLIDRSTIARRAIYPLIISSQAIPVVALAPLFLVWFGHDLLPKVLMTALLAFFPITVSTADGIASADRETLDLVRTFGGGERAQFRLVKWPGALPAFFSGSRIGVTLAVIGAVIGEMVGSSAGLGHQITLSNASLRTDRVFAAIVVLSMMAVTLFALVSLIERLALPWRRYVTSQG